MEGMATLDIVAAVAKDDPLTALNPPHATIDAIASPPRVRPSILCAPEYNDWLTPEIVNRLPIKMNKGMTASVKDNPVSKTTFPSSFRDVSQLRMMANPAVPTSIIANAIGTRTSTKANNTANPTRDSNIDNPLL